MIYLYYKTFDQEWKILNVLQVVVVVQSKNSKQRLIFAGEFLCLWKKKSHILVFLDICSWILYSGWSYENANVVDLVKIQNVTIWDEVGCYSTAEYYREPLYFVLIIELKL